MIEEEISLKELIIILLKGWKIITTSSLVGLIVGLLLVFIFNESTYIATINGSMTKVDAYDTSLGGYRTNISKIDEQVNLVNNHDFISYLYLDGSAPFTISTKIINGNDFSLQVKSNDEKTADDVASKLVHTLEDYLNYNLQNKAITYFLVQNNINVEKARDELTENENLIQLYKGKLDGLDKTIETSIINPSYQIIIERITHLELLNLSLNNDIDRLNHGTEWLNNLHRDNFENYVNSNERFSQVSVSLLLNESINYDSELRFEPLLTVAISFILGLMFGTFIIFLKNYWENS